MLENWNHTFLFILCQHFCNKKLKKNHLHGWILRRADKDKKNIIWNDDTYIYIYISTFLLQLIIYYCKIKQIKKSFLQPVNGHWVLHISCTKNLNLKESALCQNTWTYVEPYIISAFQFKTIVNDQHIFLWIIGSPM